MKHSDGFSPGDSTNLPRVETLMLMEYTKSCDKYNVAAIRGAKALLSSRNTYVDNAVGYVEVRRDSSRCFVQCRMTPEHRVGNKLFRITAEIDEVEETVIDVCCHDCAAAEGGCKHALCFLMWLVKKTEEPSTTSTICYWNRPKLSEAVTKEEYILTSEIGKRKLNRHHVQVPSLQDFMRESLKHKIDDSLIKAYTDPQPSINDFCIFDMMLSFVSETSDKSFQLFMEYANSKLTTQVIADIESETRDQVNSKLWHSMRQSRVTDSNIYQATRCTTENGALVQTIMGGFKVPETAAIKRGKRLESEVIREIENDLSIQINKSGLILISPLIGASPYGIYDDFVVEVKCPLTQKSMEYYIKNNSMSKNYQAQIQLQIYAAKKSKGLICIADPSFENTRKVHKYWVYLDNRFVNKLIKDADQFWEKYIFPKVFECVQ